MRASPGILLFIFLLAGTIPMEGSGEIYNFSYTFQGHTRGKFLLFIPYRVFYKSSASVDFTTRKNIAGNLEFFFKEANTGYMMRTSGFSGRAFVVLTADYDLVRALNFGKKKMKDAAIIAPFYNKYVKKRRIFLFKILSRSPGAITFSRSPLGIHSQCIENFQTRFQYAPEHLNICFNIYKILTELLGCYNHSYLPSKGRMPQTQTSWPSPDLDFSKILNRVGGLAAKIVKKHVRFEQKQPFQVQYRVFENGNKTTIILGEANPGVKIWEQFRITAYKRLIEIRKSDFLTLRDSIHIKIANKKERGLVVRMILKLKDED